MKLAGAEAAREGGGGEVRLGYRPALDGFRGLAILLVVPFNWAWGVPGGYTGVDLFFVLSGFLITYLLVEEWWRSGGIAIGAFYMRRALRLLPALVFMLAAMSAMATVALDRQDALEYYQASVAIFFYVSNWLLATGDPDWIEILGPLAHCWSLSVEEQFYLVWAPLVAVILARRTGLAGLGWLAAGGALASWLWRLWLTLGEPHPWRIYMGTDTRAEALLAGAALAVLMARRGARGESAPVLPAWVGWAALAALLAGGAFFPDGAVPWFQRIGHTGVALAGTALIWHLHTRADGRLARGFSATPLVWIGRVSYGVYLWHVPVAVILNGDRFGVPEGLPLESLRSVALALVVVFSWFVVERPALRRKRRWIGGRKGGTDTAEAALGSRPS